MLMQKSKTAMQMMKLLAMTKTMESQLKRRLRKRTLKSQKTMLKTMQLKSQIRKTTARKSFQQTRSRLSKTATSKHSKKQCLHASLMA